MEHRWGAGYIERCKSGSGRGLRKPAVLKVSKAALSYSTGIATMRVGEIILDQKPLILGEAVLKEASSIEKIFEKWFLLPK